MQMKKKYDPKMHSAEHILNQTMDRMYQCGRCFNAHIERELTGDEIEAIQSRVNRIIRSDLPVCEQFISKSEAKSRFNTEKLPDDVGDRIRIISIGDYDHCPCIGPHVKSTAEIGAFRIASTVFEDGVLRIRYKLETGLLNTALNPAFNSTILR
jgi:Ser-tRNA(Ala) deacylase AlaX